MKICLIGSTRFREDYERVSKQLAIAGHTVYSVSCFSREPSPLGESGPDTPLTEEQKMVLDLVHLNKILLSDAVVLVGEHEGRPYYGTSTERELVWARMHDKTIILMRDLGKLGVWSIDVRDPVAAVSDFIDQLTGRSEGKIYEEDQ